MNKDTLFSFLRTLLTFAGTFILGKNLLGVNVTADTVQVVVGAVLAGGSLIWSFVDHSVTLEMFESVIKQVITAAGGFLVASGRVSSTTLETISGLIATIAPFLWSLFSKQKAAAVSAGTISITSLKGGATKNAA